MEYWIPLNDYEGIYEVSSMGRIKHLPRDIFRKPNRKKLHDHIRISIGSNDKDGYKQFQLAKDGVFKKVKMHRIIATAFIPNPLNKPVVNHIDGVKYNNAISNLEWATVSENALHKHRVLGHPSGRKGKTKTKKPGI